MTQAPDPVGGGVRRPALPEALPVYLALSLAALALGGAALAAPLPALLDRFLPDDAFYYFQTARVFARTGFSSFDGLHPTNGYQPLWFLLCAAVFRFFPLGGEAPLRLLLSLQLICYTGGTLLSFRGLRRLFGLESAAVAMAVWLAATAPLAVNGLETGLTILLYAAVFSLWLDLAVFTAQPPSPGRAALLGALCGLLFLARTDMAFLMAGLGLALFPWRGLSRKGLGAWLAFALPLGLIAGAYLALNRAHTGHWMPVSGAAKTFYSGQLRAEAIRASGPLRALAGNLLWAWRLPHRPVLAGAVLPWALVALSLVFRRHVGLARVRRCWPFFLGATAAYIFYGTVFFGAHSATSWYYAPQALLAALAAAALPDALDPKGALGGGLRSLLALLPPSLLLSWGVRSPLLPAALVLLTAAAAWGLAGRMRRRALPPWLTLGLPAALAMVLMSFGRLLPHIAALLFLCALFLFFMEALAGAASARRVRGACGALFVLLAAWPLANQHCLAARSQPGAWNYNLYLGAQWARRNLPQDATICSGSTGILGYFSERACVNTDGLINSYDFLENHLIPGKLADYLKRWDYAIDAMSNEDFKAGFLGGAFIALPPELQRHPFRDGARTRVLRVFRLHP